MRTVEVIEFDEQNKTAICKAFGMGQIKVEDCVDDLEKGDKIQIKPKATATIGAEKVRWKFVKKA